MLPPDSIAEIRGARRFDFCGIEAGTRSPRRQRVPTRGHLGDRTGKCVGDTQLRDTLQAGFAVEAILQGSKIASL